MDDFFTFSEEKLVVTLPENPTTGYRWLCQKDPEILSVYSVFFPPYPSATIVGAGGRRQFTFLPVKDGVETVTLFYRRTWDLGPAETKKLTVTVVSGKIQSVKY